MIGQRFNVNIVFAFALLSLLSACAGENGSLDGIRLSDRNLGVDIDLDKAVEASPVLRAQAAPLKILVFGGTSGIGLQTVKLGLSRGHIVTSVARRPERMPLQHSNLLNHKGDITQRDTYDGLLSQSDIVISAIGLSPTRDEVTVYSRGIEAVLDSMAQHGKDRLLSITGIGAGDSQGHGGFFYDKILNPLLLKNDYADKTRQEEILKKSDLAWTIVRPGFLTDDAAKLSYFVVNEMRGITSGQITRADVAHFLIAIAEQSLHQQKTVLLTY